MSEKMVKIGANLKKVASAEGWRMEGGSMRKKNKGSSSSLESGSTEGGKKFDQALGKLDDLIGSSGSSSSSSSSSSGSSSSSSGGSEYLSEYPDDLSKPSPSRPGVEGSGRSSGSSSSSIGSKIKDWFG